ncbi:hypothetical protein P879_09310 [Paragonimus westermani]|uniref:Protein Wnt n=1 Tax=Paragonimus westermani TaxID=34504 RepID=A0A8T0DKI3_9TREM|nr:hypothetical protein P879_09310 [Paragonimus westermani]
MLQKTKNSAVQFLFKVISDKLGLDTIAKLLHSHPLTVEQQNKFHRTSVGGVDINHLIGQTEDLPWRRSFGRTPSRDPKSMQEMGSELTNPTVFGWRRHQRMPTQTVPSVWVHDKLRERIETYRKLMSPKQWKQFMAETLPGRGDGTFNLALFEAAVIGVRRAVAECRYQFRNERWNCSQVPDEGTVLFGNVLLKGIPQTAFVYSIINAGIVQSVAEACLGQIDNCPCNNRGRESSSTNWQWQGCDHNVHFGRRFSRRLLDTMERGSHVRYRMNLHNNKVGRAVVAANMERYCRCHGTSGSCTMRTCYRRTPRMRTVGNLLKQIYEQNSIRISPNAIGSGRSLPKHSQLHSYRGFRVEKNDHSRFVWPDRVQTNRILLNGLGRTTSHSWQSQQPFPPLYTSATILSNNLEFPWSNLTKPTAMQLIYYEPIPRKLFCEPEPRLHILGTHNRVCNSTSAEKDNCQYLCCGRGYLSHHYYTMESCHCKFIWCCRVECQQCLVLKKVETCI